MSIKIKKIIPLLIAMLTIAPLLTACGAASGTVNVSLGVFTITMPSTIKAGQVTFHITNDDTTDTHSFIIFKTDLAPGNLPLDSSGNVNESASGLTLIEKLTNITPGEVKDVTVTLQPGKYVVICDLPGHYQAGMFTGFTVQ